MKIKFKIDDSSMFSFLSDIYYEIFPNDLIPFDNARNTINHAKNKQIVN